MTVEKRELKPHSHCHDCGCKIGEHHSSGCDVARCPRCGGQQISCNCIYIVNGMDPDTLEKTHPKIYSDGPTAWMERKFDKEWGPKRKPYDGIWPGTRECLEYGFYCYWGPDHDGHGWVRCGKDHPGARADLNRLYTECVWSAVKQRMVKPEEL